MPHTDKRTQHTEMTLTCDDLDLRRQLNDWLVVGVMCRAVVQRGI